MFKFSTKIDGLKNTPSYISDVAFDPKGSILAATFGQFGSNAGNLKNKVRLYNFKTKKIIKELNNPTSKLDHPHGILLTNKHILVTNKGIRPNNFLCFGIKDKSHKPLQSYATPFKKLNEAHSLALFKKILVVTYCEGLNKRGAVVSYEFDDKRGKIIKELDILEDWFKKYGDAKGVAFNKAGNKIYVTFNSDQLNVKGKVSWALKRILSLGFFKGRTNKNGIAVFNINSEGKIAKKPRELYLFENNPRLENIHIVDDKCLVTDSLINRAYIFNLKDRKKFDKPRQIITRNLSLPHGGKFTPDGNAIAISNFGLQVEEGKFIQWGKYLNKRKDNIAIFKLD